MNIALIIAGGNGQRMNQEIPKQFINIDNRPVIIYTLEAFQKHPSIDVIEVVCLEGWTEIVRAYAKQFNITKLHHVVIGGKNGQESIRNGLLALQQEFSEEDVVLVHDAIRPMVSEEIISDCIQKCKAYGTAIAAVPCNTAMLVTEDREYTTAYYDRDKLMSTQTPQAFFLGKLIKAHEEALKRGITNAVASCTMMLELGETLHFSIGSEKNIKLTTTGDLEIFRALLAVRQVPWLKS
ncbi:MAG: IspD/TarI family cytidylyltransferase [Lachnospiraceae bacterium]